MTDLQTKIWRLRGELAKVERAISQFQIAPSQRLERLITGPVVISIPTEPVDLIFGARLDSERPQRRSVAA